MSDIQLPLLKYIYRSDSEDLIFLIKELKDDDQTELKRVCT